VQEIRPRLALLIMNVALLGLVVACGGDGRAVPRPDLAAQGATGPHFDGERAFDDLTRFNELGDLHTGSRATGKARSHIRREMRRAGFEARDIETEIGTVNATHVLARRKGASRDAILLVAPYDSAPGAPLGESVASGASVLLELARLEHQAGENAGQQPFTLLMAFIDGNGLGVHTAGATPAEAYPGSDAFGRWFLERSGNLNVRLVVWIDRVGRAQVEVARDLHSSRAYRETFFEIGDERGLQPAFIAARPLTAPTGGHRAFQALGFGPLVALVGEPPDAGVLDPAATAAIGRLSASPSSLAAVGETTWLGVARIGDRLARIDAFREDPLAASPGGVKLPGAAEAPEPAADPEDAPEDAPRSDDGASSSVRVPASPH